MARVRPSALLTTPTSVDTLSLQMHIAKNFMWESLGGSRVPVILGIWGPKGCGKTFMTELAFKKLGCALDDQLCIAKAGNYSS